MGASMLMAAEKTSPEGPRKKKKPAKPLDASVKITTDFKEKLEEVAEDLGYYPGELVEQKMGAFISVESLRIRKQKYEQAKRASGSQG
jgi:hypothetical protein